MHYTRSYINHDTARAGMQYAEAKGHRVLHENHYYRPDVDAKGNPTQVLDRVDGEYDDAPDNKPLPVANPKAEYAAAATDAAKLAVIAKRLGLT